MHTRTCSKCSGSGTDSGHPDHGRPCLHCVEGVTAGQGYKLVWFIYRDYGYPITDHEFPDVARGDLEAMGFEDPTWDQWGEAHVAPAIIDEKTNEIMDEGVEEADGWYKWNEQGPVDSNGWIDYLSGKWNRFNVKEQA